MARADYVCTGMYRHFMNGCLQDGGQEKDQLRLTLIDFLDTSKEKLLHCGHQPGPKCRCTECLKLLKTENTWILRLGTFFGNSGLNTRDEVNYAVRGNYRKNGS